MNKCPHCDSSSFSEIEQPAGYNRSLLVAYNSNTNEVNPTSGIPVKAYGCRSCKSVVLKSDKF